MPKNTKPISHLQGHNPYLICYCEPCTYIVNPFTREILLSFEKGLSLVRVLKGKYAFSCVNILGIAEANSSILSADV